MSAPRVVIISPHSEAIAKLQAALQRAGFDRPAEAVADPLDKERLDSLARSEDPVRAVVVDMSGGPTAFSMLRQARRAMPGAISVAASGPRRLSAVVQARQAGAWGYVTEPYDLSPLAERLGVHRSEAAPRPGALVAFVPAQGGNGASTVCLHTANAIAETLGGRTLLVDFDLHTGTVAFQLGLDPHNSLADVFFRPDEIGTVDWAPEKWGKMHVLVGPNDPAAINPASLADARSVFEFMKLRYRVVVADLPSALLASSVRTLEVADIIYLVCTPEITSLHLARRKMDLLKARGVDLSRLRLLVNRMGSDHSLKNQHVERIVGAKVDWAIDNDYPAVRRASWQGGLVSPESALAAQTAQLGLEIVKDLRVVEEPTPASDTESLAVTAAGS